MLYIGALALACLWAARRLLKDSTNRDIGVFLLSAVILFAIQINNSGMERYYYWLFFALAAAWVKNTIDEELREDPAH